MTYQETIEFLEISNWMGSRLGLSRMQELLHLLGDPHKQLKYVHITGTNGKGSTAAMLESVLRAAGYHTGLYTSPHLIRYNERVKIDGRNVSDEDMQHAADLMAVQIEKMEDKPTVFERITVMALLVFALKRCEVVAYEEVVDAATLIRSNGVKTFTADHFKVALQTMKSKDDPYREDQKTDEFIEIETGSEDILSQLENVMENGTKLPE